MRILRVQICDTCFREFYWESCQNLNNWIRFVNFIGRITHFLTKLVGKSLKPRRRNTTGCCWFFILAPRYNLLNILQFNNSFPVRKATVGFCRYFSEYCSRQERIFHKDVNKKNRQLKYLQIVSYFDRNIFEELYWTLFSSQFLGNFPVCRDFLYTPSSLSFFTFFYFIHCSLIIYSFIQFHSVDF